MGYIPTPAFTPVSGVSIQDNNSSGVTLEELSTTGGITVADLGTAGVSGGLFLNSSLAIKLSGTGAGFWLFTGTNLAGLATPAAGQTPAFGPTQDGKLYFYPTGGPWRLVAPQTVPAIATTAPNPDAMVPLAGSLGTTSDAGHQHLGKLPISSLLEFGHSWLASDTAGLPKSSFGRGDMGSLFASMVGCIEGNILNLAIGGTRLTQRLNSQPTPALFGGWLGACQFVYPDGARVIAEDGWTDQTTFFTSSPPTIIVHGVNDLCLFYPDFVFQPTPAAGATVGPGSYPYTYGLQAWFNAMVAVISRVKACQWYGMYEVAGTLTNDASTVFGGSGAWSQNAGVNLNSGAGYISNATPGGTFTITLPTSFQGGTVAVNMIAQQGSVGTLNTTLTNATTGAISMTAADAFPTTGNFVIQIDNEQMIASYAGTTLTIVSRAPLNGTSAAAHSIGATIFIPKTASVAWTGTASGVSGTPVTYVTGMGQGGDYCAVATRFVCTAADAGKTIIGTTQNVVAGDTTTSFWYDSWWLESKIPAPIVVADLPRYPYIEGTNVPGGTPTFASISAMNTVTAAVLALFDNTVQLAALDSLIFKRGFTLNSSINNSTATGIAITANDATTPAPFVGQRLPVFATGDASQENWLVTAVAGSAGAYTISVTRAYNSTAAVAHASGANIGDGQIWYLDDLHPSAQGSALLAGQIHLAMQTALENMTAPNQAAYSLKGVWIKSNDFGALAGIQDNSFAYPPLVSTTTTIMVQNLLQAFPLLITRPCMVVATSLNVSVLGTASTVRVGLYMSDTDGISPATLLHDFGTVATATTGNKNLTNRYKRLNPGLYWVATAAQGSATPPTVRCFGSTAGGPYGQVWPAIPTTTQPFTAGVTGYSSPTSTSGALPATFGAPAIVTTGAMPLVCLILRSKNWQ